MSKNENNLIFAPKSADNLSEQKRESDVLIVALEKCEKLEKENKKLKEQIEVCAWALNKFADLLVKGELKKNFKELDK